MKKIILILVCLAWGTSINAQNADNKPGTHSLGLHAGSSTGLGLSYRYWPSKFGFQLTGIPIFRENGGHFISAAATGLYEIKQGNLVDFYGYWGNHLLSIKDKYSYYEYDQSGNMTLVENISFSTQYNIGLGIGFRCHITDDVDFDIQGGYGIFNVTNNIYTFPSGELGLYYRL
ncbi:MAG: hypothetical protein R3279_02915 [Putridiphycobacter sp.]|nr:hypothetical protein [Putridiphycobacter sp.]